MCSEGKAQCKRRQLKNFDKKLEREPPSSLDKLLVIDGAIHSLSPGETYGLCPSVSGNGGY